LKLALDTNLLLVLVVGLSDRNLVGKVKRTRPFEPEDYDLLLEVIARFDQLIVTPHVFAETSNLLGQDDDPRCRTLRSKLGELMSLHDEQHVPAITVSQHPDFLRLGVADCGMLSLLDDATVLLTADLALYLAAAQRDPNSMNFTHLRQERTLFDS